MENLRSSASARIAFLDLAAEAAVVGQEDVARELLGDGRGRPDAGGRWSTAETIARPMPIGSTPMWLRKRRSSTDDHRRAHFRRDLVVRQPAPEARPERDQHLRRWRRGRGSSGRGRALREARNSSAAGRRRRRPRSISAEKPRSAGIDEPLQRWSRMASGRRGGGVRAGHSGDGIESSARRDNSSNKLIPVVDRRL